MFKVLIDRVWVGSSVFVECWRGTRSPQRQLLYDLRCHPAQGHTQIHTHTNTHTQIHTHTHTQIHTHKHTHKYTHTHTHMAKPRELTIGRQKWGKGKKKRKRERVHMQAQRGNKRSGIYGDEPLGEGQLSPGGKFRVGGRVCQVETGGCLKNLEARSALV